MSNYVDENKYYLAVMNLIHILTKSIDSGLFSSTFVVKIPHIIISHYVLR